MSTKTTFKAANGKDASGIIREPNGNGKAPGLVLIQEGWGLKMELHLYDADHAFMNETRPDVYNAGCAKTAWDRARSFLKKHLS